VNSWTTAENNVFAFLNTTLADTEDTNAFIGEFPANFADLTQDYLWYVALNGDGTPDEVGAGQSYCGMNAGGIFEGIFKSRETAQEYALKVRNLMPVATSDIASIQDLRLTAEPSISRALVDRGSDQTAAGELRVWRLTINLSCIILVTSLE